ncbi:MAG: MFS transporter [Planctomycetes bacterium]|nr:MFS transporter [Planctomycetota bacterium]
MSPESTEPVAVAPAGAAPERWRERTLSASVKDAVAYSVMQGLGERTVQPFAAFLGASESAFGLLTALSNLAGGLFQVVGANVVDEAGRRKRYFVAGGVVQALSWTLALFALGLPASWGVAALVLSQVVYLGAVHFTIPPWASVMGDVVPEDRRGRYFGGRNFWSGAAQIASFTVAAFLLDALKPHGLTATGFFALFAGALLARLVSVHYLTRMHEPVYLLAPSDRFSLADFLRRAPRANFGRFVFFVMAFFFGVALAGPFFGYYMLKDLGWSYTDFMIGQNLQMLALFATQPFWGRIADRIGNKRVMALGGFGVALIPVLWLFSADKWFLWAALVYDGVVWSAYQLSTSNYLYDAVTPPKRSRCTAYYNLFMNVGVFGGAMLGGGISRWFPAAVSGGKPGGLTAFVVLLLASAVGRFAACALFLPGLRELRVGPVWGGPETVPVLAAPVPTGNAATEQV